MGRGLGTRLETNRIFSGRSQSHCDCHLFRSRNCWTLYCYSTAAMPAPARPIACTLLAVFLCMVVRAQTEFSSNSSGMSDTVGWTAAESESTYGVPQVPSKMCKHKKMEQNISDDVAVINKNDLPPFNIAPHRRQGNVNTLTPNWWVHAKVILLLLQV